MKYLLVIISVVALVQFTGCSNTNESDYASDGLKGTYTEYGGYFYKGTKYSADTTLFFHFSNKTEFDTVFKICAMIPHPGTIPEEEFNDYDAVAVVKYGDNFYDMKVSSVKMINDELLVKYTSELVAENMTWSAAIPLIITTRAGYSKIKFFENGELIKEIELDN